MRLAGLFTAPLLIALAAPAFTQESTREDFKEYCRLLQGRWVGDVTWVADWPGFGKKGEKVTAYCETKIVEDGNVMIQRFFGGPGSGTGLYAYDATVKQIRLMWADSAGAMSQGIVFKKEGKWCGHPEALLLNEDARRQHPDHHRQRQNLYLTGTGASAAKTDEQHDVWARVSGSERTLKEASQTQPRGAKTMLLWQGRRAGSAALREKKTDASQPY